MPVFHEAQVQVAASPATPPEAFTAKTTLPPTATVAEAGAIVASTGGGGGTAGGVGWMTSTLSPHAATPSASSPAIRAERYSFIINSPSVIAVGPADVGVCCRQGDLEWLVGGFVEAA